MLFFILTHFHQPHAILKQMVIGLSTLPVLNGQQSVTRLQQNACDNWY
jgi:heme/copper-type cytochrome/quinol oxidase subunit 3